MDVTAAAHIHPRVIWRCNSEGVANWYDQKRSQPSSPGSQPRKRSPKPPGDKDDAPRTECLPVLSFKERILLSGSWAGGGLAGTALGTALGSELASLLRRGGSRFKPLTLKEMADLPPPEWLIDGLVPEDGLVMLYGEPKVGKSFVALGWGLSVATGVPWLGHAVKSGEVVYIYAEGVRGIQQRAKAWLQQHQRDDAPHFRAVPVAVTIPDEGERWEFVNAVRSVSKQPRLIIIDTLARNFGNGNESLAQDMNSFVRGCDDLRAKFPGATVVVVHHSGKDQSKGARGSLALQGATDAVFALTRSGDALKLTNEKQKDGEEAPPIALDLARVSLSDGKTSRVVRSSNTDPIRMGIVSSKPRKDPRTVRTDADTLEALAAFGSEGAPLARWRKSADCANDTFYGSRDRLVEAGKVIHDAENARYISADLSAGPGPELVQDGSNRLEVQKVSPEVPP